MPSGWMTTCRMCVAGSSAGSGRPLPPEHHRISQGCRHRVAGCFARRVAMAVVSLLKNDSTVSHTQGRLVPRKVRFDWSKTPLEWIPGQPFASHFINEITMILPAGEFWFCRLYNQALPYVTDDKLRDDVQLFIRQEAMHARAHGSAIAEDLKAHGIETERNTKIMDWLFESLLADQPLGMKLPKFLEKEW